MPACDSYEPRPGLKDGELSAPVCKCMYFLSEHVMPPPPGMPALVNPVVAQQAHRLEWNAEVEEMCLSRRSAWKSRVLEMSAQRQPRARRERMQAGLDRLSVSSLWRYPKTRTRWRQCSRQHHCQAVKEAEGVDKESAGQSAAVQEVAAKEITPQEEAHVRSPGGGAAMYAEWAKKAQGAGRATSASGDVPPG